MDGALSMGEGRGIIIGYADRLRRAFWAVDHEWLVWGMARRPCQWPPLFNSRHVGRVPGVGFELGQNLNSLAGVLSVWPGICLILFCFGVLTEFANGVESLAGIHFYAVPKTGNQAGPNHDRRRAAYLALERGLG